MDFPVLPNESQLARILAVAQFQPPQALVTPKNAKQELDIFRRSSMSMAELHTDRVTHRNALKQDFVNLGKARLANSEADGMSTLRAFSPPNMEDFDKKHLAATFALMEKHGANPKKVAALRESCDNIEHWEERTRNSTNDSEIKYFYDKIEKLQASLPKLRDCFDYDNDKLAAFENSYLNNPAQTETIREYREYSIPSAFGNNAACIGDHVVIGVPVGEQAITVADPSLAMRITASEPLANIIGAIGGGVAAEAAPLPPDAIATFTRGGVPVAVHEYVADIELTLENWQGKFIPDTEIPDEIVYAKPTGKTSLAGVAITRDPIHVYTPNGMQVDVKDSPSIGLRNHGGGHYLFSDRTKTKLAILDSGSQNMPAVVSIPSEQVAWHDSPIITPVGDPANNARQLTLYAKSEAQLELTYGNDRSLNPEHVILTLRSPSDKHACSLTLMKGGEFQFANEKALREAIMRTHAKLVEMDSKDRGISSVNR